MKKIMVILAALMLLMTGCGKDKGFNVEDSDYKCLYVVVEMESKFFEDVDLNICPIGNPDNNLEYCGFRTNGKIGYFADAPADTYMVTFAMDGYETQTCTIHVDKEPMNIVHIWPKKNEPQE